MRRSPLLVIFITVFIDLVGFSIVIPVLPFYVEGTKFKATPRAVGLLFASYSVMFARSYATDYKMRGQRLEVRG